MTKTEITEISQRAAGGAIAAKERYAPIASESEIRMLGRGTDCGGRIGFPVIAASGHRACQSPKAVPEHKDGFGAI